LVVISANLYSSRLIVNEIYKKIKLLDVLKSLPAL
jgi:hypothetical protein